MSGVEALGVAASILQLVDMSSNLKLISLTAELNDKSKNGRGTIQSIQIECNTIQSAVLSIKLWEEANHGQYRPDTSSQMQNLKSAVDLLHVGLKALFSDLEEIKSSLRARLRFVWSDRKLRTLLDEVRWQSNALNLLLSALHLPGPQQENKMKKVAQSLSIRYGTDDEGRSPSSILSDQEFDFDDEVVNSQAYRHTLARLERRVPAAAPVAKAPEYSIFLIPSEFCEGSSDSALNCLTQDIVDDVFLEGYKGLNERLKTTVPGAASLTSRIAHALPIRPNLSWESRWRFYIYCAPCRWHMDLSLAVCAHTIGFNGFIRVDDRLHSGCCAGGSGSQSAAPRMKSLEKTIADVVDEWRNHSNFSRTDFTSLFDQPWLERRSILRDFGEEDGDAGSEEGAMYTPRLDDYIAQADDDQRVAALVFFTSTQDIQALLDSEVVAKKRAVQEKVIYRLDFDAKKNGWMMDVFGRL
ncbi:hypothetical protein B0H19DRAFT_672715 [Mycena capillaripes]|nr:hypothetical protein B0H19DRAFT_672715 [Mycena capillaripes]